MKSKLSYITAMAAFGTISIFVRNIPLSSSMLALMRAVFAAAFLLIVGFACGKPLKLSRIGKDAVPLFLSGAAMGINWILLFEAYKYTTVSVATLSYYFAPVIVTVVSALLFRERLNGKQMLCFVGSTVGLVLVIGLNNLFGDGSDGGTGAIGVACGLGAAAFYATVILLNKRIKNVGGIDRTALQFLAAIIVLTPYVLLTEKVGFADMQPVGWVWLTVVGLFHTGLMYWLYFTAVSNLRGQEAAVLSYIDPLVACVISFAFLHEPTTPFQLVGGAMILGFTLLNELGGKKA